MKKYIIPIILLVIGLISKATYMIIGTEIAADGTLVESFGFLAIGHLFIFLSLVIATVIFALSFFKSARSAH